MRFDPEDYAFIAHYDRSRLTGQAKAMGKQGLIRLISLVISAVFIYFIARSGDKLHPSLWQPATRWAGIAICVCLVVTLVVLLVARAFIGKDGAARQMVLLVCLFVGSAGLLWPIWLFTRLIGNYADTVNLFLTALNQQPDQPGLDAVHRFHTLVVVAYWVLLVALVVIVVALLVSLVLPVVWLGKPRALGWTARRVINLAVAAPPALLILTGAGILLFAKVLVPQTNKQLSPVEAPTDAKLPTLPVFDDWLVWLLLAGILVTVIMWMTGVAKLICANLLLPRVPNGNALRVDALGLVIDELTGPRRIVWDHHPIVTARQHQDLPGSELVIAEPGRPPWAVPFLYLDVLPGTIDSAIRAATQDARSLDLKPLDKAF